MKKVYITKYALTLGIKEVLVDELLPVRNHSLAKKCPYFIVVESEYFFLERDAFLSKSDAIKKARCMRDNKISSLEKQISKLRNLTFIS